MPELPEVEVVRRGLIEHAVGRTIVAAAASHPRTVRRQAGGADEFASLLTGRQLTGAHRRGKFLWLSTDSPGLALAAHLGMSGQFRVDQGGHKHARARFELTDALAGSSTMWFVDQRTFGWVAAEELVPSSAGPGGSGATDLVPVSVQGIARDLLDPDFDERAVATGMHGKPVQIKRLLLDQSLLSGIGNIYADESLWRAGIHPGTPASRISVRRLVGLLRGAQVVLADSLAAGGTSFDSLYVNVNGASGYFSRGLAVYGRQGQPCPRCGREIVRLPFANRSSHFCPNCQRLR